MSSDLQGALIAEIEAGGPISFARFMQVALYEPDHGYYATTAPRTGWDGHYLTSPEVDPAFGLLWAAAIEQVWKTAGAPTDFRVIELGPGEGGFAGSISAGLGTTLLAGHHEYVLVERNPAAVERQRDRLGDHDRVRWVSSVTELDPGPGMVLAHEVLDNVPVHVIERRGDELLESMVDIREGKLVFVPRPLPEALETSARLLPLRDGGRAEVSPERDDLVRACLATLTAGAAAFIDYGLDRSEWRDRHAGTLVCYSAAGADDDPLAAPGTKDITAHVDWSAITDTMRACGARPCGPFLQRDVLRALGIRQLDSRLRAEHDGAIADGRGADALRALSRRQALGALSDRSGLGGLHVLLALMDIHEPDFLRPLEAVEVGR